MPSSASASSVLYTLSLHDALPICRGPSAAQLYALKKTFHLSDHILARWSALDGLARHHRYFERTCVAGLEFFGTTELANAGFERVRSEEHTSELQSPYDLVCRLLLRRHLCSTLFPYTTLFRSAGGHRPRNSTRSKKPSISRITFWRAGQRSMVWRVIIATSNAPASRAWNSSALQNWPMPDLRE